MVPAPRHTESDRLGTRRAWLGEAAIGYGLGPFCELVARQGKKEFSADGRRRCTLNTQMVRRGPQSVGHAEPSACLEPAPAKAGVHLLPSSALKFFLNDAADE